jgi:hypothetical protein
MPYAIRPGRPSRLFIMIPKGPKHTVFVRSWVCIRSIDTTIHRLSTPFAKLYSRRKTPLLTGPFVLSRIDYIKARNFLFDPPPPPTSQLTSLPPNIATNITTNITTTQRRHQHHRPPPTLPTPASCLYKNVATNITAHHQHYQHPQVTSTKRNWEPREVFTFGFPR